MDSRSLNIIEFMKHADLLNDQTISETRTAILKSLYGLPLTEHELQIYCRLTGRQLYDATEQRELTIIAGRRGGKTKIAAIIACFEAFRDHRLPPGEDGYVMLLAQTLKQAKIAFRYILRYLRTSKILSKWILRVTKDEVSLVNGIVIGCHACTYDGVRGRTIVAVICDEIGFWADGEDAANPAEEVLAALRPGTATVHNPKIIKISTPFIKMGILWEEYRRRGELDFAVWQVATAELNPAVKSDILEKEQRRSLEKYRREYLAEFTDSVNGWIVPEILDPCVARGRSELPRQEGMNYFAAIDPASRGNDYALVIVHQNVNGTIVVDRVHSWTGTRNAPLPFEGVLFNIKEILDLYGINTVMGDQFYGDAIAQGLLKLGITYKIFTFSSMTRATLFATLKHVMVQGNIEIIENVKLLQQLRNLCEEKTSRGQTDVRPITGKDDLAIALALAVSEVLKQRPPDTFEMLTPDFRQSPASLGLLPESCHLAAPCQNHPECLTLGNCLGFKNSELSPGPVRISFT